MLAFLIKSVGFKNSVAPKRITSEIVFFAHNLKLLRNNGELGIIVSDNLITGYPAYCSKWNPIEHKAF